MPFGSLLGPLEALLGGLWTQKRVKTYGFLRFLKRLFEAPDGPLGLILAASWANLVPKWGSKMGVKSGVERHQNNDFDPFQTTNIHKKIGKNWLTFSSFLEQFFSPFWAPF